MATAASTHTFCGVAKSVGHTHTIHTRYCRFIPYFPKRTNSYETDKRLRVTEWKGVKQKRFVPAGVLSKRFTKLLAIKKPRFDAYKTVEIIDKQYCFKCDIKVLNIFNIK